MNQLQQPESIPRSGGMAQPTGSGGSPGLAFPTRNYLSPEIRSSMVDILNRILADTTDLRTQAKCAHWNVKGMNFYGLHQLFDDLAEVLEAHADEIAERATALGGQAMGTARAAAANSRIPELPADAVNGGELVAAMADRLSVHDANLGEAIRRASESGDLDTADLLNEVSRQVSTYLWFLEAHIQRGPVMNAQSPGG